MENYKWREKMTNSVICYIDILGYSDIVNGLENEDNAKKLDEIIKIYESLKSTVNEYKDLFGMKDEKLPIRVSQISDTYIITCDFSENTDKDIAVRKTSVIMYLARYIQRSLILKGVLSRGAIFIGEIFQTSELQIGLGLVKGNELEKDVAIYPRIIITNDIINTMYFKPKTKFAEAKSLGEKMYNGIIDSKPYLKNRKNVLIENVNKTRLIRNALVIDFVDIGDDGFYQIDYLNPSLELGEKEVIGELNKRQFYKTNEKFAEETNTINNFILHEIKKQIKPRINQKYNYLFKKRHVVIPGDLAVRRYELSIKNKR